MKNERIIFFDSKSYDIEFFNKVNEQFGYEITYIKSHLTEDTVKLTKGYKIVCVFVNDVLSAKLMELLYKNGVRLIALRCSGYNNVDLKAAHNKITVVRVPSYSPYAVAEYTVALMLALNRKIHRAYYRTRDNNFSIEGLLGFDMRGNTAGIIGTGQIGKVLIKILKSFEMKILAYDLYPDIEFANKMGFEYCSLDKLYQNSDIISLNCPLTPKTHYMINRESIAKMKTGVMIINTGRGPLIDTKALIDALKSKKIGYAGLDVYEEESEYFFEDFSAQVIGDDVLTRLLSFPNVLITSHQGFFTREALHNIAKTTLNNIASFLAGEKSVNEVRYEEQNR